MAAYDQFLQYLAQVAKTPNQPTPNAYAPQGLSSWGPQPGSPIARQQPTEAERAAAIQQLQANAAQMQRFYAAKNNAQAQMGMSPGPASAPPQRPNYGQAGGSFQMMPGGQVQASQAAHDVAQDTRNGSAQASRDSRYVAQDMHNQATGPLSQPLTPREESILRAQIDAGILPPNATRPIDLSAHPRQSGGSAQATRK